MAIVGGRVVSAVPFFDPTPYAWASAGMFKDVIDNVFVMDLEVPRTPRHPADDLELSGVGWYRDPAGYRVVRFTSRGSEVTSLEPADDKGFPSVAAFETLRIAAAYEVSPSLKDDVASFLGKGPTV